MVDSGNLLFKPGLAGKKISSTDQTQATIIAQTFVAAHDAVVAIGSNDLVAGSSFLKKLEEKYSFHFLSANLATPGTDTLLFQPYITKNIGGLRVAIIGLTGMPLPSVQGSPISLLSWETLLPTLLQQLSSQADMILLLSNLSPHENNKIAQQFDAINIIFQSGNTSRGNIAPYIINNTLICQTITRGKYQGVLKVTWNESGKWQKNAPTKTELNQINKQLRQVTQKIQQSEQTPAEKERQKSRLAGLHRLKQKLEGQQKKVQQQLTDNKNHQGAAYNNRFIALSSQIKEDTQTVQRIRAAHLK